MSMFASDAGAQLSQPALCSWSPYYVNVCFGYHFLFQAKFILSYKTITLFDPSKHVSYLFCNISRDWMDYWVIVQTDWSPMSSIMVFFSEQTCFWIRVYLWQLQLDCFGKSVNSFTSSCFSEHTKLTTLNLSDQETLTYRAYIDCDNQHKSKKDLFQSELNFLKLNTPWTFRLNGQELRTEALLMILYTAECGFESRSLHLTIIDVSFGLGVGVGWGGTR